MKRSSVSRALAAAAVALCLPFAAAAALMVPVSLTRSVSAFADADPGDPASSSFSASDFGPFDHSAGATSYHSAGPAWYISTSVRQRSSLEEERLSVDLTGDFAWVIVGGTASVQSIFDLTFDLTAPASYRLVNGLIQPALWNGTHVVTLLNANGQVIAQPPGNIFPIGAPELGISAAIGVLDPGRYRLTAQLDRGFPGETPSLFNAAVDLRFTLIPEPGTALLVIAGLLCLAGWRKVSA